MENVYKAESSSVAPPVNNYNSLSNENCQVAHDIVDIHAEDDHEEQETATAGPWAGKRRGARQRR